MRNKVGGRQCFLSGRIIHHAVSTDLWRRQRGAARRSLQSLAMTTRLKAARSNATFERQACVLLDDTMNSDLDSSSKTNLSGILIHLVAVTFER